MFEQLKQEGELPKLDLECLARIEKVEKCNEISKLSVCNLWDVEVVIRSSLT